MDFAKVKTQLLARGYAVTEFDTAEEAAAYLDGKIDNVTVGFGGSATLERLDLFRKLSVHNTVYWHWKQDKDEARKAAMQTDVYLLSANALAESGEIVNIDGVGNRLSAALFGHQKVYFVIGENKLTEDLSAAIWRARNVAAPKRARQFGVNTPCVKGERCYDCKSPERICRGMSIHWGPMMGMGAEIVLIHEELGL